MPELPGISHQRAVKAFEKAGFWIVRQGRHITGVIFSSPCPKDPMESETDQGDRPE